MKRPKTSDRCQKSGTYGGRCNALPGQCIHNFTPTKFGTQNSLKLLRTAS